MNKREGTYDTLLFEIYPNRRDEAVVVRTLRVLVEECCLTDTRVSCDTQCQLDIDIHLRRLLLTGLPLTIRYVKVFHNAWLRVVADYASYR